MKLIIRNLKISLDDGIDDLKRMAAKKLKLPTENLVNFKVIKESVDARKKASIGLVCSILTEVTDNTRIVSDADIVRVEEKPEEPLLPGNQKLHTRPVIIGSGPAGIFAGLVLAENGYKPVILERGERVDRRAALVERYWKQGVLDPETNVQFGEGGAGTFSDGKLTTRIHDRRCELVLNHFCQLGAHEEILYKAKPHIGTDVLKKVVENARKRIETLGGEVRFNAKVTDIRISDGRASAIIVNGSEELDAQVVILAIGHSARDTFQMLLGKGISFQPKPFSIGVRIEHPQELINRAQYGDAAAHPRLGAADYQLFYKNAGRTAYSFCMCPGGLVVASASEPETIVTNGMSEFARDRENANSALVVSVEPSDFGGSHPLMGIEFQRQWERLAYMAGGSSNAAPVQRLEDFINGTASSHTGMVKPSYTGETKLADLNTCLPAYVTSLMKESVGFFDRRLRGFAHKDVILTGVETRTSSPVRISRDDKLEAMGISGLYPAGEGAGYAGGIVSAAVDGIRIAEEVIRKYSRP